MSDPSPPAGLSPQRLTQLREMATESQWTILPATSRHTLDSEELLALLDAAHHAETLPSEDGVLAPSRVNELLAQFGIADTDTLKHRLEDWERWKIDVVALDVQLSEAKHHAETLSHTFPCPECGEPTILPNLRCQTCVCKQRDKAWNERDDAKAHAETLQAEHTVVLERHQHAVMEQAAKAEGLRIQLITAKSKVLLNKRVEELEAEVTRLRAALQQVLAPTHHSVISPWMHDMRAIARSALGGAALGPVEPV